MGTLLRSQIPLTERGMMGTLLRSRFPEQAPSLKNPELVLGGFWKALEEVEGFLETINVVQKENCHTSSHFVTAEGATNIPEEFLPSSLAPQNCPRGTGWRTPVGPPSLGDFPFPGSELLEFATLSQLIF